jgi:hypothetical protein
MRGSAPDRPITSDVYQFSFVIPLGPASNLIGAWQITKFWQNWWLYGQYFDITPYLYICQTKTKCNGEKTEIMSGQDKEESWELIDSGTEQWWTQQFLAGFSTPGPFPNPKKPNDWM